MRLQHALFGPLDDAGGRSEAVTRRLGGAIALGLIRDGEQLPPEQALASSLNVSTVTLREALADLRDRGLVETRRGRGGGSFVKVSGGSLAALSRARLTEMGVSDLRELGDLHVAVAGSSARLAAERASEAETRRLRELVDRLAEAEDDADVRRFDGRYHIEVAAAAQSVRLTMLEIELQGELAQLGWRADGGRAPAEVAAGRREVVEAIARRRPEEARRLTEEQLGEDTLQLIDAHIALMRGTVGQGGRSGTRDR
jgi:DNA-binding FadR family transcriptional regulator